MSSSGILKSVLCIVLIMAFVSFGSCCSELEWKCTSGECVYADLLCDGAIDCADGSDETQTACSQLSCPSFAFRCSYGACVSASAKCNGIKDCVDNSDESFALCQR